MNALTIFLAAAATVLVFCAWVRQHRIARHESSRVKARLGIRSRWEDALAVDDDELLLDPTTELPEHHSMVILVGDIFDGSERGQRLRSTLKAADVDLKPSEGIALLVIAGLLSFIAAELLLRQGPIVDGGISVVCAVVVPWLIMRSRRDRRLQKFTQQLPAIAELLSNALRAGLSLQGAIDLVAREIGDPAAEEFGIVMREVRLGGTIDDALEALAARMPSPDLGIVVTALRVQRIAGGNLIKSMGALSRTLSERQRTHEEIKTMMTEPMFASYLMPVLALLALAMLNYTLPGFLDVLFHTVPGLLVVGGFVGLQVGGFVLIQRIARIKV